ncbi:MAG: ferritin-like domain-containing protein, partial [Polyangiales bacterium]
MAWRARMEGEHRSTTVFSSLASQLIEANATLDAKTVMLRMAQDELRHTETCGEVVSALGGGSTCMMDVSVAKLARHRGCSPEERALRNVIYTTCLSEMVAVARLVDELDATKDPFLRDATRRLLADEVLHGQFGFLYLEAWRPWLETHGDVVASLETYLTHAFAVLEEALAGRAGKTSRVRFTADERALGLAGTVSPHTIFHDTITHAVVPGLERFGIDATRAWKKRRRLDVEDGPLVT